MFGLLSHISFLRLSSGHSGPVLTLQTYDATCASLPSPHLLLAYASVWAAFPLVVGVRCIFCICVCVCVWLGCPLKFKSSPLICLWVGFLLCGNFSCFMTPSPGQVSVPKSFVSIFVFYILSYLLLKRLGCLSGCLVSSASVQKLFCGIAQHSNDLLMNLWGRKWSPCPIPLPSWDRLPEKLQIQHSSMLRTLCSHCQGTMFDLVTESKLILLTMQQST